MPLQDLLHFKQTNPAVIGVARTGERRGLRVPAAQAQQIHALLKPDVMFLPNGPRMEFLAGPFPYGMDRAAIARALICMLLQLRQPLCLGRSAGSGRF